MERKFIGHLVESVADTMYSMRKFNDAMIGLVIGMFMSVGTKNLIEYLQIGTLEWKGFFILMVFYAGLVYWGIQLLFKRLLKESAKS